MTGRKRKQDVAVEDTARLELHGGVQRPTFIEQPGNSVADEEGLEDEADHDDRQEMPPGDSSGRRGVRRLGSHQAEAIRRRAAIQAIPLMLRDLSYKLRWPCCAT